MLTISHAGFEVHGLLRRAVSALLRERGAVPTNMRRGVTPSDLDQRIEYDVGLTDRRPLPASPGKLARYPASVEAMLNRRF